MSQSILLNYKMIIPTNTYSTILRERLIQLLDKGNTKRLSILRAPSGYGKTTLLSQYASRYKEQTAWVSLDHSDNDPIRFWQYIAKAIGLVLQTDLYERLLPLFTTQPRISIEVFVDIIKNEFHDNSPKVLLILDDYQAINHSLIHRSIARFIDHLPNNLRLIIGSRSELPLPLLRWKANTFLQEINTKTIKFTYKETAYYLEERPLPSYDLNTFHEIFKKTEGWPAGIKLVAKISENKMLKSINNNEVSGNDPYVSDYLFHELLSTLTAEEREFLLRNSVMKFLEPELCNQISGWQDSERMLNSLENRGLLINKLDEKRGVFGYHHLFGDFLIQELRLQTSTDDLRTLYSTAATSLYTRDDFMNAIDVALRGEVYHKAVEWIEKHVVDVFTLGHTDTFVRWVELLVKKEQIISSRILSMHAYALALLNDYGRALQIVQQLETKKWVTYKNYQTEVADFLGIKSYILLFGWNDLEAAKQLLLERLKLQSKDSIVDAIPIRYNVFNPVLLRTKIGANGKLWPEEIIESFFNTVHNAEFRKLYMTGFSYGVRAETLVEKNKLDEALPVVKEAIRIGRYYKDPGLVVPMFFLKCQIQINKEDYSEVQKLLDLIEVYVIKLNERHWIESINAMRAYIHLLQNKVEDAKTDLFKTKVSDQYIGGVKNEFWWFVQVRLLIKKKEYERGLNTIIRMRDVAQAEGQISTIIEASLLQAQIHKLMGDTRLSLDALHESLEFGYPYGYIRTFLNEREIFPIMQKYITLRKRHEIVNWINIPLKYAEKIMKIFTTERIVLGQPADQKDSLNDLTPRELEVLQLLTTGLSNREIAEELFLSPGTVRIYLSNIYAKLQVTSRTQAVIIAKERDYNRIG